MECDRVHCCIVTVAENRGMRVVVVMMGGQGGRKKLSQRKRRRAMEMDRTVGGKK